MTGASRLIAAGWLWGCLLGRTRRHAKSLEFRELGLESCELQRDNQQVGENSREGQHVSDGEIGRAQLPRLVRAQVLDEV